LPRIAQPPPGYRLFEEYTLDELARRLPYAEGTLLGIKAGRARVTNRFRATAAGILNRPADELFQIIGGGDE